MSTELAPSEPYSLSYVNSEEGGQTQQRPRGSHGLLSILPTLLEIWVRHFKSSVHIITVKY